jgi:hypothetical protein
MGRGTDTDGQRQGHKRTRTGTQADMDRGRDTDGQGQGHRRTGAGIQTDTDMDRDTDTHMDNFTGQLTKK